LPIKIDLKEMASRPQATTGSCAEGEGRREEGGGRREEGGEERHTCEESACGQRE
jgi:hypothetical protein